MPVIMAHLKRNPHPGRASIPASGRDRAQAAAPKLPAFLRDQPDGVYLTVKLQPRASRNGIEPSSGEELRVRVTAPPVDSAANEALVRLLADFFACPRNAVQLVRGHTARHKTLCIRGRSAAEIARRLSEGTAGQEHG